MADLSSRCERIENASSMAQHSLKVHEDNHGADVDIWEIHLGLMRGEVNVRA